ncbi:MAG TPA: hypothetical protein VGR19_08810 [Allosphingosinicella sp.]|nr:hypothetical protein [Allosphingosinicella sp.]
MKPLFLALASAALALPHSAGAAKGPDPLFAGTEMIQLSIRAPFDQIRASAPKSEAMFDGSLSVAGAREAHPIKVAARGITRRKRETCSFPPLRMELAEQPPAGSLFHRQKRLKLVTHCQPAESFQQHVLLEYAAYQLMNVLTPRSLRVRLAQIDYLEPDGDKPFLRRMGFLIEDADAAARRNGLEEADTGNIRVSQLSPKDAARYAVFQYLIGNLDWSMDAGPPGSQCCHNSKLLGARKDAATSLIPVPYDFDFSGLVDAPYAVPPDQVPVASVRTRRYRGYCRHNAEARQIAAEVRSASGSLQAVISQLPQLPDRPRRKASAYLQESLSHLETDRELQSKLLKTCL